MQSNPTIEAAVQAYLSQMTPEKLVRSNAYFEGGYVLQLISTLIGLALAIWLMESGWSVAWRNQVEKWTGRKWLQRAVYWSIYFAITFLLTMPWSIYQDYWREHTYGLSNLTFAGWLIESAKGFGVGVIFGAVFFVVLYKIIARWTVGWWKLGAFVTILFSIFTNIFAPVLLAPIFNDFKPLPAGEVRDAVLAMARANNVPASEVYQFDASKQTSRISANVSGMFGTARVSLNDNLLKRGDVHEIRSVMGHELGHYVLGHSYKIIVEVGLLSVFLFWVVECALTFVLGRFGARWKVRGASDIATLPLLLALATTGFYLATPVWNSIVRSKEIEADMFGLNLAREPDGFARTALLLSEYRKMSPGCWEEIIFYDHPSGEARIRAAMTWKQENLP